MFIEKKGTTRWAIENIEKCAIDAETDLFRRFKKETYEGDINLSKYLINGTHDLDVDIYRDTPHYLLLRYSGSPIAMSSYSIMQLENDSFVIADDFGSVTDEILCVVQLQGICMANEILRPLKWERMFVSVFEDYAKQLGFSASAILPASKNYAMRYDERSKMRYDVTAKRLGYKMNNGLWLKNIN
ncbi:MAG: hypothetical protein PHU51_01140 [Candidatus Nanoarchaeia archaeon]|nr:hypothetical protein [Candidatus Nanoarchaeia archaeon]